MKKYRVAVLVALAAGVVTPLAMAQQNVDRNPLPPGLTAPKLVEPSLMEHLKGIKPLVPDPSVASGDSPLPYVPPVACDSIGDTVTRAQCWQSYRASLHYYETGLAHRTQAFEWQHLSSIIIFFVVLTLVAAGLFFAWLQFRTDLRARRPGGETGSTVELSASGLKVSSPVLGLMILALSLGFFYLYLQFVYPIHELF